LGVTNVYGLRLLAQPRVQRLVLVFLAVLVLGLRVIQFIGWTSAEQWGYDLAYSLAAATQLVHGEPIYSAVQLAGPYAPQAQEGFLYPPAAAALFTPLALVTTDPRLGNWIWAAIGAAILVASVLALARLLSLADRYPLLAGRGRWWLVAAAFAFPPVVDELVVGNVNLLLLGLFTLAWLGLHRATLAGSGSAALTGLATGAAALVKIFPGFLVAWFAVTRRAGAIGWTIAGAVILAAVALPVTGLEPWRQYPTVLANLGPTPQAVDALAPTMWLTPVLGFTAARLLVTAVGLVIVWLVRTADLRLGYAVAVTTAVLVTPAMYASYLTILVLPLLLGLAAGVRLRWLAIAYILMWGGMQPALGDLAWVVNRGFPTAGALVLMAGLVRAARNPKTALA
jgi:alpha-1,2-mannosyltransferase